MNLERAIGAVAASIGLALSAQAQIVVNGSFETGDFTGWTQFGDSGFDGVDGFYPHTGAYQAYFGSGTSSGIRQNLVANAGDRLTVQFWITTDFGDIPNSCSVTLDGQPVSDLVNFRNTIWRTFSATITVTHANPELVFTLMNASDYFELDDVTVTLNGTNPGFCAANCDGSSTLPILTANDFQCFLNLYAAGDPNANCDASTATPILTANDFQCFLNKYAAGCT